MSTGAILNPPEEVRGNVAPDWRHLHVHGKSVWLEANSLALWEGDECPPKNAIAQVKAVHAPKPKPSPSPGLLVLLPTLGCNLRCSYCYNEYGPDSRKMSYPLACRAIDMIHLSPRQSMLRVSFFGGEPLLEFDLIQRVVPYAQGKTAAVKGRCSAGITTNGVLITDEIAQWCGQNRITFILSLDGPQTLHDKYRRRADGTGSFDAALNGAKLLSKYKVPSLTLRGTFVPDDMHLLERVQFLNGLVRQGIGHGLSVEPSCLGEHECSRGARGFAAKDLRKLSQEYHALAEWMLSEWRDSRIPRHMQLERTTRRLLDRRSHYSTCGAGNGYWTVGPDGTIYSCHHASDWSKIGHMKTGLDANLRAPWIDNRLFQSPVCTQCSWRFVCGGACRDDGLRCTGEMWKPSRIHCAVKWMWCKEAIWMISEARREGFLGRLRETADRPVKSTKACCGGCGASCQTNFEAR